MKEVTYEDWIKNPTPRMMWAWDDDEKEKIKCKVVYVIKGGSCNHPVRATTDDDTNYEVFKHCAEIKKQRRMTNKELARWLREKPTREYKYNKIIDCSVYSYYTYAENYGDEEVRKDVVIREYDGEWREPLVDVGE